MLTARDAVFLKEVAEAIRGAGGAAIEVAGDLRNPDFPARIVDAVLQSYGRIDILVNNAGATKRGRFLALTRKIGKTSSVPGCESSP